MDRLNVSECNIIAEILQPPLGSLVQCPKLHSGLVYKFAKYITVLTYYAQLVGNFLGNARMQVSELKKLEEWWLQNFSYYYNLIAEILQPPLL